MRINKILVTGGAGFIGSFLVDELIKKGYKVRILDNLSEQVHEGKVPEYLNKKAEFIQGDIRDIKVLESALKNIDAVYHMAAAVGVAQSNYEVSRYMEVNTLGTANLLNILANNKTSVKKLIVPSSNTGLGEGNYSCKKCGTVRPPLRLEKQLKRKDWNMYCPYCSNIIEPIPTNELANEYPNSMYAIGKKSQQDMSLLFGSMYNFPVTVLRFFNVYGPRQSLSNPYTGVSAIFISRLKNNQKVPVYEDGLQSRDFISVHDVVSALVKSLKSKKANNQLINIGSGKATSILELAKTFEKLLDKEDLVEISHKFRKGDIRHCFADISKARQILNWAPKVSLEKGFKELIEWSKNQEAKDNFNKANEELKQRGLI